MGVELSLMQIIDGGTLYEKGVCGFYICFFKNRGCIDGMSTIC